MSPKMSLAPDENHGTGTVPCVVEAATSGAPSSGNARALAELARIEAWAQHARAALEAENPEPITHAREAVAAAIAAPRDGARAALLAEATLALCNVARGAKRLSAARMVLFEAGVDRSEGEELHKQIACVNAAIEGLKLDDASIRLAVIERMFTTAETIANDHASRRAADAGIAYAERVSPEQATRLRARRGDVIAAITMYRDGKRSRAAFELEQILGRVDVRPARERACTQATPEKRKKNVRAAEMKVADDAWSKLKSRRKRYNRAPRVKPESVPESVRPQHERTADAPMYTVEL
jgi:hypothetical protein